MLASQINKHVIRYTPSNRFATAVFVVLSRDSGELTYVNAGHNAPIVSCDGCATSLEATGMPLGLLSSAQYEAGGTIIPFGGASPVYGRIDRLDSWKRSRDPFVRRHS
jgi:serine phosphatase RsbU (regulator of sigma subunit)